VVLFGSDYWADMLSWIRNVMLEEGKISPEDVDLLYLTDSPEAAVQFILNSPRKPGPRGTAGGGTPARPRKHDAE
jgi:predicted Rossmann-fold nucleotide-binding protein